MINYEKQHAIYMKHNIKKDLYNSEKLKKFEQISEKIFKKFSTFNHSNLASNVNIDSNINHGFINNIKYTLDQDFTIEILGTENILNLLTYLKNEPEIDCKQLVDLCAVDYLYYGKAEWATNSATKDGFNRARDDSYLQSSNLITISRFAVVYHLLSYSNNLRIRVKCFLNDSSLTIPSCISVWPSADWYEREAFDLFGINFIGHPNLTKILTEEKFVGFPFRKDFPLSGNFEVRFDAKSQQVIKEPVEIEPYNVVPKVIRDLDNHK